MAAITRWVQYDVAGNGTIGDGDGAGGVGTRGYALGTASIGDTFTISDANNKLYLNIDGGGNTAITLYSGTALDPRFVAQDITNKIRSLGKSDDGWDHAICKFENTPDEGNRFKIYSGALGGSSGVVVDIASSNNAYTTLGFGTRDEIGGTTNNTTGSPNNFNGTIDVSGTYRGFLPEVYKCVITTDNDAVRGIDVGNIVKTITYDGTMTTGGIYNNTTDTTYTITIDVTNGTTMGGGTGNVPTMAWSSSGDADDSTTDTELLYPDSWYLIGTKGLMVTFSDAVFASGNWTVPCYKPDYAEASNPTAPSNGGTAAYLAYSSNRGDMGGAAQLPTTSGTAMSIGSRGVEITFNPSGGGDLLGAGDEFFVICNGPNPQNYNISSINYGNVTVSTESDVKCVSFEIESGAYQLSSVKFGLQSHGSFSHHDAGNNDTLFRFGTSGPGNPKNGLEWTPNITPSLIDSDTPPAELYATKANLSVVSTADASQDVGNYALNADPVWLGIKLGSSETGSSSCNYRTFFDYS